MKSDNNDTFVFSTIIGLCILLLGICVLSVTVMKADIAELKRDAITLGHAEYNKINGNWQWITNR